MTFPNSTPLDGSDLDQPDVPLVTPQEIGEFHELLKYCPPLSSVSVLSTTVTTTTDRELTFRRFSIARMNDQPTIVVEINTNRALKVWAEHPTLGTRFLYDSSNREHPGTLTSPQAQSLKAVIKAFNAKVGRVG